MFYSLRFNNPLACTDQSYSITSPNVAVGIEELTDDTND